MIAYGENLITGTPVKTIGWFILVIGAIIGTGGIGSLVYTLVMELRAKLAIMIRHARLEKQQLHPDQFEWHFMVELIIKPPAGYSLVFQSDDIKAKVNGGLPGMNFEINNMGISPSRHPVAFDGAFAELTVGRQMAVVVEGKARLTTDAANPKLPDTWNYEITMTDATGEWTKTCKSGLLPSQGAWASLPDPA